jgi:FAD/FMN-containing dehydrogenase
VRRAARPDLADLVRIWSNGWAEVHVGHMPPALEQVRTPDTWAPRALERLPLTAVAEIEGQVVGLVVVDGDELEQVYVAPEHRGTGAGAFLLAAAEETVRLAGHHRAWLAVVASNERARRFYATHGWVDEGPFVHHADAGEGRTVDVPCHRYTKVVGDDATPRLRRHGARGAGIADLVVDGQVLLPGDDGYDGARTVWNAMVDRRPRVVVRCASVDDVRTAVRAAREHGLEIGVLCGGHSVLGLGVPDDGLMIDLSPMGAAVVDLELRRVRVQGGALLGALDRAAQHHGLATTAGNVSHTGVGGLTLGGGMGWLARQCGMTCDNVTALQVVTADGGLVRAAEDENPDLFWGLRGGGGNFGVVTDFELRLHPISGRALSVELDFPVEGGVDAFAAWRDLSAVAPREATFTAFVADGTITLGFVWVGDVGAGRRYASTLASLGRPAESRFDELSYLDLQRRDDSPQGHSARRYFKGHYFETLPDAALEALIAHDPTVAASVQAYGGAILDVPADANAFAHRGAAFEYVAAARWTDAGNDHERMAAARRAAATLEPFARGVYVNALSDEGAAGVARAYDPATLARLTRLKDVWDPENVFHLNPNVPPTGWPGERVGEDRFRVREG